MLLHYTAVNHHTLIREFYPWYQREMKERGYCPGNWKWIIPPQAAAGPLPHTYPPRLPAPLPHCAFE